MSMVLNCIMRLNRCIIENEIDFFDFWYYSKIRKEDRHHEKIVLLEIHGGYAVRF